MTDKHLAKQVRISVPTLQRLEQLQHPGQSVDGVITEILDKCYPLPKAPEPTQTPPKPRDPSLLDGDHRIEPLTIIETFDNKDGNNANSSK